MKEYRVLAAALCMMLVSLIVSGVRNISASAAPESATYDIYEESERLVALTFDEMCIRDRQKLVPSAVKKMALSAPVNVQTLMNVR